MLPVTACSSLVLRFQSQQLLDSLIHFWFGSFISLELPHQISLSSYSSSWVPSSRLGRRGRSRSRSGARLPVTPCSSFVLSLESQQLLHRLIHLWLRSLFSLELPHQISLSSHGSSWVPSSRLGRRGRSRSSPRLPVTACSSLVLSLE